MLYRVFAKVLANQLKLIMPHLISEQQSAFMSEKVLTKLGFCDRGIHLMMECIANASYSILINGEPHGDIIPTRGLSQGDPLSPYLFLMSTEGLMKRKVVAGSV